MELDKLPQCCGVYAIRDALSLEWLYIGKSQNIGKRILNKYHPAQITKDAGMDLAYFYTTVELVHINWLEKYLIRHYKPAWNGGTSFNYWARNGPCCDVHLDIPIYLGNIWEESA